MWSFYFMLLEFLEEDLPWRKSDKLDFVRPPLMAQETVTALKEKAVENPTEHLWRQNREVKEIH